MLRGMGRLQRYASVTTANYVVSTDTSLLSIDYLIVGGGGSGGGFGSGWSSGGGGGGGMLTGTSIISYIRSFPVVVGGGGAGGAGFNSGGVRGGDSSFNNLTAYGGGAGQMFSGSPDINGGSGGGILGATALGVPQTYGRGVYPGSTYIDGPRQGWDGSVGVGNIGSTGGYGGGGGGASGAGSNSGAGGAGLASAITGSSVTYSAGGSTATQSAGINPGDGGGSAGNGGGGGGAGKDGIVVISYSGGFKFTGGSISPGNNYSTITSGSLSFNGTSSYLTTGANSLTSENFVMECWFYLTSNLTYVNFSNQYQATIMAGTVTNGFWFNISGATPTPTNIYIDQMGSGTGPGAFASGLTISINSWHHIAIGRVGTDFAIWFDGIGRAISTAQTSGSYTAGTITVGYNANNANYRGWFPGYISNVRIVKGATLPYDVFRGTITVLTSPLTAVSGTYLLLNTTQSSPFTDSSSNNFSVTPTSVTSSTQQPNFYIAANPTIHTFTASGTLTSLPSSIVINYFIIAGGGGGGGANGGGGGAGGYMTGATALDSKTTYTITVGSGGAGAAGGYLGNGDSATGFPGTSSSIIGGILSGLSTYGGGYGGSYSYLSNQVAPGNGGSGGGSAGTGGGQGQPHGRGVYPGSTYISANRQGYDGGDGVYSDSQGASAGGGGAGAAGGNASPNTNAGGGIGIISAITGVSTYYGGGGGGGGTVTAGGLGGGGSGGLNRGSGVQSDNGSAGTDNTGGGGGGAGGGHTTAGIGGKGGSGVVILSYTSPARYTGGTITTSGQNVIHRFTGTGSLIPI